MALTPPTAYVILAAGKGSRLGGAVPKPLTRLADGRTILQQQLDNLTEAFGPGALAATSVVVGYRSEELLDALPSAVRAIHNPAYDTSNTAKSLLMALKRVVPGQGVLWLNGDVVFSPAVLRRMAPFMAEELSAMAVVEGRVGAEEIKYTLDEAGYLAQVSKTVGGGLGEAVGINYVGPPAVPALCKALAVAAPQDYFEAAIEALIRKGYLWAPAFATELRAVEVDFAEDLQRANAELLESLKAEA